MRRLIGSAGVVAVLVASLLGVTPGAARAATGDVCTWDGASGATDLNDFANYIPASGSNCTSLDGAQLVFPATAPASGSALALTADLSVDSIVLQGSYTLGGAYTLTLSGATTGVAIDATSGSSTIAAHVSAASTSSDLDVEVATGASLEMSGTLSASYVLYVNSSSGGTGTLTLSANNSTTLSASIYVDGGALEVGNSAALGTAYVSASNGSVVALDAGVSVPDSVTLGLDGTLEATGSGTATWGGDVSLNGSSTLAAATGAVLQVPGTVEQNGSTASVTVGQSGWTGTVVLTGVTGTVISNSNSWAGSTTVDYGTLQIGANNAVSTVGAVNVMAGATLDLHGHDQNIHATTGSGTITDSVGGGTLQLTASSSLTVTETLAGAANVSVYTGSGATVTLAPTSASGNTYTGSTATFGFGTLLIKAASSLGATSGVTVGTSSNDGVLQLDGTMTLSAPIAIPRGLVEVTGTGSTATLCGAITAGTSSYTTGTLAAAAGDALEVSGPVTGLSLQVGTASLTGTVTLSNSSSTATTEVVAGTLAVSQALGSVTVDAGATLAGTGTVDGLTSRSSGTVIVGADASHPGTLTAEGFVYIGTGSTLGIHIAGTTPGSGYSQLVSSGSTGGANLYGNLDVTVDPSYAPTPGTTFDVFQTPWFFGAFANAPNGGILTVDGYSFLVTYVTPSGAMNPTDVILTALGAPAAPTNVVATIQKTGHGKTATQSVVLTWSAPTNDGGTAITDYLVNVYSYGHGKGGGTYTLVSSSPLDTGSTELTFTVPDSALSGGGTYAFTVAAVNKFGPGTDSDYSNTIKY